jgi:hypothetical protein
MQLFYLFKISSLYSYNKYISILSISLRFIALFYILNKAKFFIIFLVTLI